MDINKLLDASIKNGGSDLHIRSGIPPKLRVRGHLRTLGSQELTPEETFDLVKSITPESNMNELDELGSTDYAISVPDGTRFRVSAFRHQGRYGLVLRQIPNAMLTFDQIGLPDVIREICTRPRGMFLVTGPTGSGKTTTLTAMINHINETRQDHIVTIEDPIEFVHNHKKCVITQREIGADTTSFSEALRRVLRQDPDIILVGEMRDLETIESAITAAETGHLVFGTLHTTSASKTVNRLIDAFPTTQQAQIRAQLSMGLIGVLSQNLMPTADGKGRVAAYELMLCNAAIQNLIREAETYKIDGVIQTGSKYGMRLLDDHLFELYAAGRVKKDSAVNCGNYPDQLLQKIEAHERKMLGQ